MIFNLFYLCFCFGPDVCAGNFIFKICGVMPWCGSVRNIILLRARMHAHARAYTHTLSLSQNFTNNFFLHITHSSHVTF